MNSETFLNDVADFAREIIELIVLYPSRINIKAERLPKPRSNGSYIKVTVKDHAKCDHGKLIGHRQQTHKSIETLLQTFSNRSQKELVQLHVLEAVLDIPGTDVPEDTDWNENKRNLLAMTLAKLICRAIGENPPQLVWGKNSHVGRISSNDNHDCTILRVDWPPITPEFATALSILMKAAGRNVGRKVHFDAKGKTEASPGTHG